MPATLYLPKHFSQQVQHAEFLDGPKGRLNPVLGTKVFLYIIFQAFDFFIGDLSLKT